MSGRRLEEAHFYAERLELKILRLCPNPRFECLGLGVIDISWMLRIDERPDPLDEFFQQCFDPEYASVKF